MNEFRFLLAAATLSVGLAGLSNSASAAPPTLFAVLNGGNECNSVAPPAGPVCALGDLDAVGSATLIFPTATSVCFAIVADNLAGATAAHVHSGVAGINGGVVITLAPPAAPGAGNPGASSGCVNALPAGLAASIVKNPGNFYVNVHNGAFVNGAIRGQLF